MFVYIMYLPKTLQYYLNAVIITVHKSRHSGTQSVLKL